MNYDTILKDVTVPALDIDATLAKIARDGWTPGPQRKLEQRIVWALFEHLAANGWTVNAVNDGDEWHRVDSPKEAMEIIFNLDDSWVRLLNADRSVMRRLFLVGGNGTDIIADYSASEDFAPLVETFCDRVYADEEVR
jgi:hypothetical protein